MQVINWLALQPQPSDLEALRDNLREALPLRTVYRLLVETILRAPQSGRPDLLPSFQPSQTYKSGQKIALFIPDSQNSHRFIWQVAHVKQTRMTENPVQGRFQVLTLEVHGRQIQMASGIVGASSREPDFSAYSPEDLDWLVEWVLEAYAATLQATVRRLIESEQIRGRLLGQIFLPEGVTALSVELVYPLFEGQLWLSTEEILRGLPDLHTLEPEDALGLLRATLRDASFRSLGEDRWTTSELFHRLDRDVPRGLTTPRLHSSLSLWTKRDKKDLAGYGRKSMPAEARRALEELEAGDRLPPADQARWRPPKTLLRLPTLNYLHITQACVPVGYVLGAFAPGVQMVFVQFMDGDHQPCLLDRENGLLKAIHPDLWRNKILEDGVPAGTSLWLEHEGKEKYRVVPNPVPFKRRLPCKLAHFKDGQLHIEQTQIAMKYESSPTLFKAELSREEAANLFADVSRPGLREVMIYAMQEICAADPDHRAHWTDLLNAVCLLRTGSPIPIASLLYTQPCFEPLGGGYFRYRPVLEVSAKKIHTQTNRLSQLWEKFAADPVVPIPRANEREFIRARGEDRYPVSPTPVVGFELPYLVSQPEAEPEIAMTTPPLVAVTEDLAETIIEEKNGESIQPIWLPETAGTEIDMQTIETEPSPPSLPTEETASETQDSPGMPFEDAQAEFSFFSPSLGLETRPAWTQAPPANPRSMGVANTQRLTERRKFPVRPLHKQPLYRRILYYLRAWLQRTFRSST